jgi:hypothetical protein
LSSAPWSRLDDLLDGALSRPPGERRRYLDEACRGEAALRLELEGLLAIAEADDGDLRPGGGLETLLAREVLDDLEDEAGDVPLPPGTRLGRFEVSRFLGAGSVGRVYRALDPTLGREVAIKALAEAFRGDAVALRRFEREARLLATVNHPNVAAIHGLEMIEGAPYLILELVEGDTLEERLRRGPLPVAEAVEVARQIAEALEEAHRKGVVHRDLKPANVKLTGHGRVKVLDFGLARAADPAPPGGVLSEQPPTVTTTGGGSGVIQGTAPYMSPEQARGLPLDARSDVWAFGCVLYEMLVGRRAFAGTTVADVLAAVVRDDVDLEALPPGLPPGVRRLVARCLRRDARQRLQDMGDARLELSELGEGEARPAAPRPRRLRGPLALLFAAAALLVTMLGTVPAPRPGPPRLQTTVVPPPGIALAEDFTAAFALSPDASTLAFAGTEGGGPRRLYLRRLDELEARALPGTEEAWQPFFSPDGRWLAFFADRKLKKIALAGGLPVTLADLGGRPRGGWWGSDGRIVLARSSTSGLSRVGEDGGAVEDLTRPDLGRGEHSHRWPQVLPGAEAVLFTVDPEGAGFEEATIQALSLRTGERRVVVKGGTHARFLPPRQLVYAVEGRLFAVGFDPQRLVTEGSPVLVLDGVRVGPNTGGAHIALADDGTLVYVRDLPVSRDRVLAWMDDRGRRTALPGPPRRFREPRLSPRGDRVAVRVGPWEAGEVWIQDVPSGTLSQLTFDLRPVQPVWAPDGQSLMVGSRAGARWRLLRVDLAGGEPQVVHQGPFRLYPADWSPDGRFLAFEELHPERGWGVAVLELGSDGRPVGAPRRLGDSPANETHPRFSPHGRWLADDSDELDDMPGVYVAPFGRAGVRINPSREAGRWPEWGGAGELFYWRPFPSQMHRVGWREEAGAFRARADEVIWSAAVREGPQPPVPPYDFDPGSRRFLFLETPRRAQAYPPREMTLFLGWGDLVRRRLAAAN